VPEYLIAHTAPDGSNVAQAQEHAKNEAKAVEKFHDRCPDRTITVVAQKDSR